MGSPSGTRSRPMHREPTSRRSSPSRRSGPPSTTSSRTRRTSSCSAPERRRPLRVRVDVADVTGAAVTGPAPPGLAMSRCLREEVIDDVLLERAEVASSWRRERWDSLRTLTPNWMNRLPGLPYTGGDPDGYMTAAEVADSLVQYAHDVDAPVTTRTTV